MKRLVAGAVLLLIPLVLERAARADQNHGDDPPKAVGANQGDDPPKAVGANQGDDPSEGPPSSSAPVSPEVEATRAEARALFDSGLAHFNRGEWSAALADFVRSREIVDTNAATKNAAICLQKEGRRAEARAMFEALLRNFPDLSAEDRAFAEHEITALGGPASSAREGGHLGRLSAELDAGAVVGLSYGGDVRYSCGSGCSAAVPLGFSATARGGYVLASGLVLGVDVGWTVISAGVTDRSVELLPRGLGPNRGRADDTLALRGFRFGPSAGLRFGDDWPVTARLGAGLFVGSALDARTARLTTSAGVAYEARASESPGAVFAYLAPEARIGRELGPGIEVSVGVTALALFALDRPEWKDEATLVAGPPGQQGDGVGTFGRATLTGGVVFGLVPSAAIRYAF